MWVSKIIFFISFSAGCGAQGEALPVPSVHLQSQWSKVFPSEQIKLSCEINSKSWTITWYRDEQEVRPSDSSVILSEESQNLTVNAEAQSQSGKYRCKGNSKTNTSVSTTYSNAVQITVLGEKLKPTLSINENRQSVFVGEAFTIRCLISQSVSASSSWEYVWYLNDNPMHKSFKDEYTVVSAEESHDGDYSCKVRRGGVTVSTASDTINVKVSEIPIPTLKFLNVWPEVIENEEVSLHCETAGPDWAVTWLRDGVQVAQNPNIKFTEQGARLIMLSASKSLQGRYTCKALHNTRHVSSGQSQPVIIKIHDTPKPTLSKSPNLNKMYVGETVNFTCAVLLSAGWIYKWSKDDVDIVHTGPTLSIVLQLTNGGGYSCKAFRGSVTTLSSDKMTQAVDDVPAVKLHSLWSDVYKNEAVTLSCDAGSTDWRFSWLKNGQPLTGDDLLKITDEGSTLQIVSASMSHTGTYVCKAQHKTRTVSSNLSQPLNVKVYEIPVPQLTPLTSWMDVFPSETVELGCGVSSAPQNWTYQWKKDDQTVNTDVFFDPDHAKLSIRSASASHKGQYKCRATLKSRHVVTSFSTPRTLKVYDQKPQPTLVQHPDYSILFPQEPMKFHCQINVSSGWEFVWYQNEKELQSNQSRYEVTSPDITDSGSYSCKVKRGKTHSFSFMSHVKKVEIRKDMPKPVLSQWPDVDKVYLGELVVFKCELNVSSDWEYHWLKKGHTIPVVSASYTVTATHLQEEDYKCKAKRRKTLFETESQPKVINISEIPIPSVSNLTSWLDAFPTETVKLRCGMETSASDWSYTWSKDGQMIKSEDNMKIDQDGSVLTIVSSVSHTGEYSCMANHKKRLVKSNYGLGIRLEVYDAKPRVTLVQDLEFNTFYTEDSIYFNCGVNVSSGWDYTWFKNNNFETSGPNYTIKHAHTSHSGEYNCRAKRGKGETVFHTDHSRSVAIKVKERPSAALQLLTGWSEVFSTDSLVLQCEAVDSEDDDWKFEWFKGSEIIEQPFSKKHTVTPQNDPDQNQYTCKGKRDGRPAYTKTSEPLKTTNLLLKRRVLLSISGCVVFGLCAVFLGCIVLRVCRKPVVDQEKPDEVDLFLTRAELSKHAPNPLTEYVTDEDLKDIAKEADENGTISCESTLLPIKAKEDEATPSDSNNTTGNGEMVSFKQ
ncbi:hemicentin-1-like [Boleophthalmus pectinirostris]|uniref:hemicentin-1-like n=1 Tax=Boleophthalmus pectinirostris TaxID=150288 RepID=UPI00242DF9B6|nr:hemicentin-1-like [Boleophthalmus pectinirostris]